MRALVLALACGLYFFGISDSTQDIITPGEAMQAVRAFEGNPNLELQVDLDDMEICVPSWAHQPTYMVEDDADNEWEVNATTGEVVFASYGSAIPGQSSSEPFGPLSRDECQAIALAFAQAKYAGFASMGFELESQEWDNDGWCFVWRQRLGTGAWTPNHVSAWVNPADGRIQAYSGWRIPSISATAPLITAQEAVATVQASTRIVSRLEVEEGPVLWTDPDGTFWDLTIDGLSAEGEYLSVEARVNALDGSIVYSDEALLGVVRRGNDAKSGRSANLVIARDVLCSRHYGICWGCVKPSV